MVTFKLSFFLDSNKRILLLSVNRIKACKVCFYIYELKRNMLMVFKLGGFLFALNERKYINLNAIYLNGWNLTWLSFYSLFCPLDVSPWRFQFCSSCFGEDEVFLVFFLSASKQWMKSTRVAYICNGSASAMAEGFLGVEVLSSLPGNVNKILFSLLSVELTSVTVLEESLVPASLLVVNAAKARGPGWNLAAESPSNTKPLLRKTTISDSEHKTWLNPLHIKCYSCDLKTAAVEMDGEMPNSFLKEFELSTNDRNTRQYLWGRKVVCCVGIRTQTPAIAYLFSNYY